ncbi:MAG: Signal recognition particle receptor FtsY [Actinomycetota bacterium]|jgi:fused signal recognition particle receptor
MAFNWFRKSDEETKTDEATPKTNRLSNSGFARALKQALGAGVSDETWDNLEEVLLMADVGLEVTNDLIANTKKHRPLSTDEVMVALKQEMLAVLDSDADRDLKLDSKPAVILMVGVNGTGKTTSTGKLAYKFVAEGRSVVMGAADTFRAAAADQLATWADRTGAELVRGVEQGDPAAVAFDAVARAVDVGADVVLIDTAGRLHTKSGLMDELSKVRRVVERKAEVSEVLLVLDATTGQNGLLQAKVFAEAVNLTGIVLTKLDGSAKGGIIFAVQRALGVPVKFVGLGEAAEDLIPFSPLDFVDAIAES